MIQCDISRDNLRKSCYENTRKTPLNDECINDKELSDSIESLSKMIAMMWTDKPKQ